MAEKKEMFQVVAVRKDKTGVKLNDGKWYVLAKGVPCPEKNTWIAIETRDRGEGKNKEIIGWRAVEVANHKKNGGNHTKRDGNELTITVKSYSVELWAAKYSEDGKKKLQEVSIRGYTVDEVFEKVVKLKEKLGIDIDSMGFILSQEVPATGEDEISIKVLEAIRKIAEKEENGGKAYFSEVLGYLGLEEKVVSEAIQKLLERGEIIRAGEGAYKPVWTGDDKVDS